MMKASVSYETTWAGQQGPAWWSLLEKMAELARVKYIFHLAERLMV
jgi:hypothetical protein